MRCQRAEARGSGGRGETHHDGRYRGARGTFLASSCPFLWVQKESPRLQTSKKWGECTVFLVGGRRGWVSPWPGAAAPSPPQPAAGAAPFGRCLGRGPCSWEQGAETGSERSPVSSPHLPTLSLTSHLFLGPQFSN